MTVREVWHDGVLVDTEDIPDPPVDTANDPLPEDGLLSVSSIRTSRLRSTE